MLDYMLQRYRLSTFTQGRIDRFFDHVDDGLITEDERDQLLSIAYGHVVLKLREKGSRMTNTTLDEWIYDLEGTHYRHRVIEAGRRFEARRSAPWQPQPVQLSLFS